MTARHSEGHWDSSNFEFVGRPTECELRRELAQTKNTLIFQNLLIREFQHRTSNLLQLTVSVMTMQAAKSAPDVSRPLLDAVRRLTRISEMYALLNWWDETRDEIAISDYLRRLCQSMRENMPVGGHITIQMEADDARWGPDTAIPLALIAHEAITNSIKHAFADGSGNIALRLRCDPMEARLSIMDDGLGIITSAPQKGIGLRLIDSLAGHLKGQVSLHAGPRHRGTVLTVRFPNPGSPVDSASA